MYVCAVAQLKGCDSRERADRVRGTLRAEPGSTCGRRNFPEAKLTCTGFCEAEYLFCKS